MWGRASRVFANRYALSARLDVDFQSMDRVDFEIDGEDDETDPGIHARGFHEFGGQRNIAANARHRVTWEWVKGHAGHPENERADALARAGMAPFKSK